MQLSSTRTHDSLRRQQRDSGAKDRNPPSLCDGAAACPQSDGALALLADGRLADELVTLAGHLGPDRLILDEHPLAVVPTNDPTGAKILDTIWRETDAELIADEARKRAPMDEQITAHLRDPVVGVDELDHQIRIPLLGLAHSAASRCARDFSVC